MNMQAIQIMILLLDSFIKLAPWRIVTEAMDRIGCGASDSLARSLVVIAAACAGLCTLPAASIFGPLLLVPTFRSSCSIAAPASTNFGKLWALANLLILVPVFYLKFLDRIRRLWCRNFK
ncbi:hypothetical protein [Bradyrhizobium sp.]|jgi:hypothetical protein|uniref:hypothetical protein n=2 Tax=Bradyrhizobium sp. TaxID=376 RepID=UPI003BBDCEB0